MKSYSRTCALLRLIKKAVLALLGRASRPERQPPLPPFAARLCPDMPATDLRTPALHWPTPQAPAHCPPPAQQTPLLAGLRPGAPRHPPPGCRRAATAARRAALDQFADMVGMHQEESASCQRGSVLPICTISIRCSTKRSLIQRPILFYT